MQKRNIGRMIKDCHWRCVCYHSPLKLMWIHKLYTLLYCHCYLLC